MRSIVAVSTRDATLTEMFLERLIPERWTRALDVSPSPCLRNGAARQASPAGTSRGCCGTRSAIDSCMLDAVICLHLLNTLECQLCSLAYSGFSEQRWQVNAYCTCKLEILLVKVSLRTLTLIDHQQPASASARELYNNQIRGHRHRIS